MSTPSPLLPLYDVWTQTSPAAPGRSAKSTLFRQRTSAMQSSQSERRRRARTRARRSNSSSARSPSRRWARRPTRHVPCRQSRLSWLSPLLVSLACFSFARVLLPAHRVLPVNSYLVLRRLGDLSLAGSDPLCVVSFPFPTLHPETWRTWRHP